MVVEFDTDDGRTTSGTVGSLNRHTVTIVIASGRLARQPVVPAGGEAPRASTPSVSRVCQCLVVAD